MTKSRFEVPHTLVVLFGMVILAQLLSYLHPAVAEALGLPLATLDRRLSRVPGLECSFLLPT